MPSPSASKAVKFPAFKASRILPVRGTVREVGERSVDFELISHFADQKRSTYDSHTAHLAVATSVALLLNVSDFYIDPWACNPFEQKYRTTARYD